MGAMTGMGVEGILGGGLGGMVGLGGRGGRDGWGGRGGGRGGRGHQQLGPAFQVVATTNPAQVRGRHTECGRGTMGEREEQ